MPADWIALDASAPQHRLWRMQGDTVRERQTCAAPDLAATIARMSDGQSLPIRATGLNAAPRAVPCAARPEHGVGLGYEGVALTAMPALSQAQPPHKSWGAEAAIAGFVALNPKFDGVLCLPGTATVWAHISAEEVVSFQAFLTPQLAAGLTPPAPGAGFEQAVSDGMARPERLAERLASAHSQSDPAPMIWGALIGAELAAARPYWLGQQVAVAGNGALAAVYAAAITAQGLPPIQADGEAMLLKGLAP